MCAAEMCFVLLYHLSPLRPILQFLGRVCTLRLGTTLEYNITVLLFILYTAR